MGVKNHKMPNSQSWKRSLPYWREGCPFAGGPGEPVPPRAGRSPPGWPWRRPALSSESVKELIYNPRFLKSPPPLRNLSSILINDKYLKIRYMVFLNVKGCVVCATRIISTDAVEEFGRASSNIYVHLK